MKKPLPPKPWVKQVTPDGTALYDAFSVVEAPATKKHFDVVKNIPIKPTPPEPSQKG